MPRPLTRRTYAEIDYWRRYQRVLPERVRLRDASALVEEWWPWRGADIHLDRFAAPSAPLTVILLHGGGGYGRLLAPFGVMLRRHGYEVVAPDLPGYGLSVVPQELFTHDCWVDCAADLVDAELRRTCRPVVLFGLSLGGYLAYLAAARGRKAAGVIATTLADPRLPIVREQFARHKVLGRVSVPVLRLLGGLLDGLRVPIKWFSNMGAIANDPELVRLMNADPLGAANLTPLRFLRSLLGTLPAVEPEHFDLCPVLLAHPAADRWTTVEASRPFFDRLRGPKELVMLERCGHFPIEEPGIYRLEQAVVEFLEFLGRLHRRRPAETEALLTT